VVRTGSGLGWATPSSGEETGRKKIGEEERGWRWWWATECGAVRVLQQEEEVVGALRTWRRGRDAGRLSKVRIEVPCDV